jgi:hypothetical protein
MDRHAVESLDKETLIRLVLSQAAGFSVLTSQVVVLTARVAELEARLGLPPKTPDNSSTPPSQGRKASRDAASKQLVQKFLLDSHVMILLFTSWPRAQNY